MKPTRRVIPGDQRHSSSTLRRSRDSAVAETRSRNASEVVGKRGQNITPDLIPHSQFHTGSWLLPIERPEWYYFAKKANANNIANGRFLNSVDKPIRPLVRWLHERGIKTTPSCSGHHMAERSLEKIYEGLKRDAREIRHGGLQLRDIETGKVFLYQNPKYSLPWTGRDFLRKAVVYQRRGVLGVRLGNRRAILAQLRQLKIPGVYTRESDGILLVFTENSTGDNRHTWKKVSQKMRAILEHRNGK